MKTELQIKAIAELDGWEQEPISCFWFNVDRNIYGATEGHFPSYLTSRDAIVPVIEKQPLEIIDKVQAELFNILELRHQWLATPAQLSEALLRATGKWIESV